MDALSGEGARPPIGRGELPSTPPFTAAPPAGLTGARPRRRRALALVALLGLAGARGAVAQEPRDTEPDFAAELPRIPPRSPQASLEALAPLDGLRVELVAAEPAIADPVAVAVDERGRLFVVCMRGYSEQADERIDEIRLLEDSDGDGRFDRSTVFAGGLSWPTGIACWAGGVFVIAAPDILFLRDGDGDGVADVRDVVFTGFGRGNVQGLANSLAWGLDNRFHGATSSSGGSVGRPGVDDDAIDLRGRDFSFDPRARTLAAESGGAQHGLAFDDAGRKLVCSNSSHIELVVYDDRYARRNPALAAPPPRRLIASDGGQAEVFRRSPVEPWRIVRTRLRVAGAVPGPIEGGGRAAGYFTGATGVTVIRGDAWPPEIRGQAVIGDVGSNVVHRKRLEPDDGGVTLRAVRVDAGRELLASSETWFRPVQFHNAPDGTLWVIDMYREVIEHPASLPPVIKRHLDLTSGNDRGRIWRLFPEGSLDAARRAPPRLDRAAAAELAALLEHPNAWHRETASRLIYERQDRAAAPALENLAATSASWRARLHAICALDGLGALTIETLALALGDAAAPVRERAVRLAESRLAAHPEILSRVIACAGDADARVRLQVAFTLGETTAGARLDALARLLARDGASPWMRFAAASALASDAGAALSILLRGAVDGPGMEAAAPALADLAARAGGAAEVAAVLAACARAPAERADLARRALAALVAALAERRSPHLALARQGGASSALAALLDDARRTAYDAARPAGERAEALRLLGIDAGDAGGGEETAAARERIAALVGASEPIEVQLAAIDALARAGDDDAARHLIAAWNGSSPRARRRASEALLGRVEWTRALLAAIESGKLRAADVDPDQRAFLVRSHPDAGVRALAARVLAAGASAARDDLIARYRDKLDAAGDAARGATLFREVCSPCHRAGDEGVEIGPNLVAFLDRGAESFLVNVLDPSREALPQYLSYLATLRDGRIATGLIAAETATSITFLRPGGETETLSRRDVATLSSTGLSLMPEGLEERVDPEGIADLLAWLRSRR